MIQLKQSLTYNQSWTKRVMILIISILLFSISYIPTQGQKINRPNIILITAHDLGQHLFSYGVKTVQTPNIQILAKKGILFTNCYSTSAVCSPGRGSLLTGRYPQSNGLMGLTHSPWWWKLNDEEVHMAKLLSQNGYDSYLIGLQHITSDDILKYGYKAHLSQQMYARETVAQTVKLIKEMENSSTPFFLKVGFKEVHRPFKNGKDTVNGVFVPPYLKPTRAISDDLADFQSTIRFFDAKVGEILDALYQSDVANNTLVILTSEHGIPYPGAKWTIRKAGIEIPLIILQPGTVFSGGKQYKNVISNVDILPTILDYLKIEIPQNIEGVTFFPYLMAKTKTKIREAAFSQYTPDMKRDNLSRSIITEKYHLIRYFDQGRTVDYPVDVEPVQFASHVQRASTIGTRPFFQLFDIEKDPYELVDIGQKQEMMPAVLELNRKLYEWMVSVNDPLLEGPLRTPYYEKALKDFKTFEK